MIKKNKNPSPWKWIITSLLIGFFYVMAFYTLFGQVNVLLSMLYFLCFFVVFHFFCIETYRVKFRHFLVGISVFAIIMSIQLGNMDFRTIASILVLHVWIVMLWYYLQDELTNTIKFSSLSYFISGWYIFTVYITVGYGLALIGLYTSFPYTCEWLSASSNQVVDTVSKPFKLWLKEVWNLKDQTKLFFWAQVKDVVQLDKQLSVTPNSGPLSRVSKGLVKQIQTENVSTSMGICDYLLNKVNMEFGRPEFAASSILLLFLLLYPFVRIVFWVMSLIAFVIFKICYLVGIYKVSLHEEKIEKIT